MTPLRRAKALIVSNPSVFHDSHGHDHLNLARIQHLRAPNRRHTTPVFYSFPSTPFLSADNLPPAPEIDSDSDSNSDDDELLIPAWSRPPPTFLQRVGRSVRSVWKKVTNFLTPPLWASLISLAVALNRPVQHLLEVHLHPVQGAITQAGNCSIPITLVVLGAYFYRPAEKDESVPSSANSWRSASFASMFRLKAREEESRSRVQQRAGRGEGRTIFVAIFARMVVVPAIFLPFMAIGALRNHPPVFQE
jgi:predicted permease